MALRVPATALVRALPPAPGGETRLPTGACRDEAPARETTVLGGRLVPLSRPERGTAARVPADRSPPDDLAGADAADEP
jgi:hypothetical protein